MKVLVTGIAGKLGRLTARKLIDAGHQVIGIDRRAWPDSPEGLELYQVDIRKRPAEDVFRTHRPDAAIHMATVTHLVHRSPDRMRVNLYGTRAFIHHCHNYGVKQAIFVGRHTYYGAAADSPLYHTEDEPPMSAHTFPELADLVAADLYAASALWRYPEIATCVLRMVYTLGPSKHGTLAAFLEGPTVPLIMGFDPLFHFMHEQDAAKAIVTALTHKLHGIFNVSGPTPVPLSTIVRAAGRRPLPIPAVLFKAGLGRLGLPNLPAGALDHLRYPIVVDSDAFRRATGYRHDYDERETINAFRTAD
ncbi:MAG: epimerase [Myxococcales bacterium SG8_38]|nr:MAG: epimerase [Myxococcales bacterium SG8_38]